MKRFRVELKHWLEQRTVGQWKLCLWLVAYPISILATYIFVANVIGPGKLMVVVVSTVVITALVFQVVACVLFRIEFGKWWI